MRARIRHTLTYRYSEPVQLGAHRLCLKPRAHGFQRLLSFDLSFSPDPHRLHPLIAASGDDILRANFFGFTDSLEIQAISHVETQVAPLLEVCLAQNEPELPYPVGHLNGDLMGSLEGWLPNGQHEPAAVELAQEALMGSDQRALMFLQNLVEMIQDRVKYTQRHAGPAWPAGRTLKERVGSCRDLAVLMIEASRCVGLPARFVSGYHLLEPKPDRYDLHAWAEVYLPGAGWRGFDPSGIGAVDDRYIPLATSSKPSLTAAVSGSFSGPPGVESELSWAIEAEVLSEVPAVPDLLHF
ncbi:MULTISPECIES: transglutaminase family protein [unclassified Synechococcus]|uniref:transglutaminase family protein n=1 Tax=unclassified Synechococcus TaxID=2626047 RepID=UPI0021A4C16C|nr:MULTISPECIES: transglutaminase family protein [unclassified Synechococcus]MCT0213123.1 transglutaminase family protein [Synechococcus sp. CS-1326]MCT0232941.1 transglutaminase family protein [Synechococcus sp. CS-1327]